MWVDDDRVSRIELDFLKLGELADEEVPAGVERFALRIDLGEFDGNVEVPEGAVEVNFQELFGAMMGGMMGSDSASGGSAGSPTTAPTEFPCELLEGESEEVQAQYAEECPELQG
jgi:hypothetical protein